MGVFHRWGILPLVLHPSDFFTQEDAAWLIVLI